MEVLKDIGWSETRPILYSGKRVVPFEEKLFAVLLAALWYGVSAANLL